jgi:uncharacterized protein (DUF2147 family)
MIASTLLRSTLALALLAGAALPALAADETPVGLWKNIDDTTGKPKAMIRISESNGVLEGKIEKLFRPADQEQNPVCAKCEGALKDQPLIGLPILAGLKKSGDEYSGGTIIDPENGKVYKSKLSVSDGGKKLNVRGYIGMPILGRSQTWVREQ